MKKVEVKKNLYYDSVSLMLLTKNIKSIKGVNEANICMGTPHNKEILQDLGFENKSFDQFGPNDLLIAVDVSEDTYKTLIDEIEKNLNSSKKSDSKFRSLSQAIEKNQDSNLVIVSIPGQYASIETERALRAGKNVMLFSDNVSIEEEVRLKKIAKETDTLLMGPDCGTSIINGKPLGFANKINKGPIGIIGASGTGIQEVSSIIDKMGSGISQAIGTGGRDLSKDVDGITFEMALNALINDPETKVITLISKPPHPVVSTKIINIAKKAGKPVVISFIGTKLADEGNIYFAKNLKDTAIKTVCLANNNNEIDLLSNFSRKTPEVKLSSKSKYIRGLYSGGTLCEESIYIALSEKIDIHSNLGLKGCKTLLDINKSLNNTFIDMGDDYFTKGKPHPMIDPDTRNQRIVRESEDLETAIILLDFVLGYGSHKDPVGATIPSIQKAYKNNPNIIFIASVTGTVNDPQNLAQQVNLLERNNVIVLDSNADAAEFATELIKENNKCPR